MTFKPAHDLDAQVRRATQKQIRSEAKKIRDEIVAASPQGTRRSGNKRSWRVRPEADGTIRLYSVDPNAHIIEFGSQDSLEYAPVRRTLRTVNASIDLYGKGRGASGRRRGPHPKKVRKRVNR